jgi:uncharacterized protein (DUF58 family)
MGHPYVKRFIEERELTVVLLVDCSASHQFGSLGQQKREVAAELAALLAFSAISNNDRVGLVQFTDRIEQFIPPRKGTGHVLRLIREVLYFEPQHRATRLKEGLDLLNRVFRRRAIVFLFSDFLDEGYERAFKRAARKHDLVAIRVSDPREEELPAVGLVDMEDPETGQVLLLDTSNRAARQTFAEQARQRREQIRLLAAAAGSDLVEASTDGRHLDALIEFFRRRERQARRS